MYVFCNDSSDFYRVAFKSNKVRSKEIAKYLYRFQSWYSNAPYIAIVVTISLNTVFAISYFIKNINDPGIYGSLCEASVPPVSFVWYFFQIAYFDLNSEAWCSITSENIRQSETNWK